jgi:hypothetical protein
MESEAPHRMFEKKGYLHVVSLILVNVSVALTPVLHFLCSRQMRQGLVIMIGGYINASDFKTNQGLRSFRKRQTVSNSKL